jgi:hypothetical protein
VAVLIVPPLTLQATALPNMVVKVPPMRVDGNDDDDGDEGNHDAVFDGGRALFVATDT